MVKIYISESKIANAGRGVFAKVSIKKGDLIESCPFIEIPNPNLESLEKSILITYFYFFGNRRERVLMALGFGSIYNHNYAPNAQYKIKPQKSTIEFFAIKNIKTDEEITVNYNQGNGKTLPLWFEE